MSQNKQKMVLVVLCTLVFLLWFSSGAPAATLEVGSGKTYATIQAAVNDAVAHDEIVVYEGTYDGFTVSGYDTDYLTIRAYKNPIDCTTLEERVTIISPITFTNWSEYNLIEGFYVTTSSGSGALQHTSVARKNTWKNMVIYGSSAAAIYSSGTYGDNKLDHGTIYDNGGGLSMNSNSQMRLTNTIIAFNGYGYGGDGAIYGDSGWGWNCLFDNPHPDPGYGSESPDLGDINSDPQFFSTDPSHPMFLWLKPSSPCIFAGSGASTIGALGYTGCFERHVGDGCLYSTIQEAVNAADPCDHIIVHEGIYFESVTLDVTADQYELTIAAYAGDKVLIVGGINIQGDSAPVTYNEKNLIKGLYIQPTSSTGCYSSYARNNTWQNVVVYGNPASAAFGGVDMNGQDAIEHCSVQGCGSIGSYGTDSSAVVSDMVAAFNAGGWSSGDSSPITFSDWYNNPSVSGYDGSGADEDGTCISSDPLFVTTYSNSEYFLLLKTASSPCVGTGSEGSNMGALPDSTKDFGSPDMADDDPVPPDDPCWSFEYLGQDWASPDDGTPTETPVWNRYYSGGYCSLGYDWETTDWFLRQYSLEETRFWWYQTDPACGEGLAGARNWDVDFNTGVTIEFRARVYGPTTAKVYAGDGSQWFNIAIQGDPDDPNQCNKLALDGTGDPVVHWIDTTEWHVYRLVIEADRVGLYIDGAKSPTVILMLQAGACNDQILFGDRELDASVFIDWDYIRVYLDGPVPILPGELIANTPVEGESFGRQANNRIEIVSSRSLVALPSVPLSIVMGGSAIDVAGDFTYSFTTTNEPNDTLVATENGTVLQNNRWYRIAPAASPWIMPFAFDIPTQRGDIDSDQDVDVFDLASLQMAWSSSGGDLGNVDLDGDGDVDKWDYSVVAENWSDTVIPIEEFLPDVSFTEFPENPVIEGDVLHCSVRRKNATSDYMCWYTVENGGSNRTIALATSPDGVSWTKQGNVIVQSNFCHMPTVLWDPDAGAGGLWKMWYVLNSSTISQHICYATSDDGDSWDLHGMVLQRSDDPDAVDYTSTREPTVIYDAEDSLYKMWYWANNTLIPMGNYGAVALAYAESDDGIIWTKYGELMDEWNLGSFPIGPEVLKINGFYYLWYDQGDIYYAGSFDGIVWLAYDSNPVISRGGTGWKSWYIQAPTALYDESAGKLYLWYNGDNSSTEICNIGGAWTSFEPR